MILSKSNFYGLDPVICIALSIPCKTVVTLGFNVIVAQLMMLQQASFTTIGSDIWSPWKRGCVYLIMRP